MKEKGFTLIEMLVALAVGALITGFISMLILHFLQQYKQTQVQNDLNRLDLEIKTILSFRSKNNSCLLSMHNTTLKNFGSNSLPSLEKDNTHSLISVNQNYGSSQLKVTQISLELNANNFSSSNAIGMGLVKINLEYQGAFLQGSQKFTREYPLVLEIGKIKTITNNPDAAQHVVILDESTCSTYPSTGCSVLYSIGANPACFTGKSTWMESAKYCEVRCNRLPTIACSPSGFEVTACF